MAPSKDNCAGCAKSAESVIAGIDKAAEQMVKRKDVVGCTFMMHDSRGDLRAGYR